MRRARADGGFLVLVGDSSVGKTRLLCETARDMLPDFVVLAPDLGRGSLVNSVAEATFPLPKLIVWIDELQRFLDGPYLTPGSTPITATAVRHLLDAPTPVVVLGAIWPEHATQLRATEPDPQTSRQRPRYPGAADILRNGRVQQETLVSFSETEREAAAKLSSNDPRLATALADPHYNVTEVLAGAPQLVARYKRASEEQQAVLNAAIDARRLGTQAPLTGALLCAAARGYLSTLHPDDTWFSPALTELTRDDRQQDHATAPLIPVLNEEKAKVLGYTVADYLMQHVSQERRSVRVPASTWDAFLSHVPDPADTARLANSARNRLLYRYAIPLYRPAADAGDRYAASRLAGLLANRDDLDELRDLDDLDDLYDLDELRGRADADGWYAAIRLAGLLADRGDLDELRGRADAGDGYAAMRLAGLLADRGDLDELRGRADADDGHAVTRLADRGDWEELDELRGRADDDGHAAIRLADMLANRGDLDELRGRVDAGDGHAAMRLADMLANRGDLDELRGRVDAGDGHAAIRLAWLLADRGDLDELRGRADAGDPFAGQKLAGLLADRGDLDELRGRVDVGDPFAGQKLPGLLEKQGRGEEAERLRRFGLNPDGSIARA